MRTWTIGLVALGLAACANDKATGDAGNDGDAGTASDGTAESGGQGTQGTQGNGDNGDNVEEGTTPADSGTNDNGDDPFDPPVSFDLGSLPDAPEQGCGGSGGKGDGELELSYIWIANSAQGTISKLDTITMIEVLPPVSMRVNPPAGFDGQDARASARLGRATLLAA